MILYITFDAVDEIVNGDDGEVLVKQLDDAVGRDVTAASGHEDGLAMARHHGVARGLKYSR